MSLKLRLGLGAAVLGLVALATAATLVLGMDRVTQRLDAALAAEQRIDRYAALSTQVSTFIVVAAEAIQSDLRPEDRRVRLEPVTETITETFERIRADLDAAVNEARALGLDEQSRRATQSLGIARMEALFASARENILTGAPDPVRLRGHLDIFATGFDPLLNEVVVAEVRARDTILAGFEPLRRSLTTTALVAAASTVAILALFFFALVRPQFRRLDLLRDAAQRIGREDFSVSLPARKGDEIGLLFHETNRMARALSHRKDAVDDDWARLNEVIAERTEALRAANDRLEKTDEDRRRFFADISHELRTPLTVILMESQLGRAASSDAAATAFATIESRALRLNRRIDDLLRLARSESGQLALEAAPVDLADVLREALEETRAELDNAGMAVTLSAEGPVPVIGDRNWLRQVAVSLIRNAIRHARTGEALSLVAEARGGEGVFEITDNGPGVAEGDLTRVFERFTQTGGSEARAKGFGMGLALARWVIEAQEGRIALESPVAGDARLGDAPGTKVTVGLPAETR